MINLVDEFILYDDAQYTKNDWRNRNKIITKQGIKWITIPVKHSLTLKINEIKVLSHKWRKVHWKTLQQNYSKSKYFKIYFPIFEDLYLKQETDSLSEINYNFICAINHILGIRTKISRSSEYELKGDRIEKLIHICNQAKATDYISGPAAKEYIKDDLFLKQNINLSFIDYSNYPMYNRLNSTINHHVSILDLIFNEGYNAPKFMKSFNHDL